MKAFKKKDAGDNVNFDGRGKSVKRSCDEDVVKSFIESFHPVVSHYNRENTPNRRYLPCDVNVVEMHKTYNETHTELSYSTFYRIFKEMKISISSLGNEECEVCERHRQHQRICTCETVCDISEFMLHRSKFKAARCAYRKDAEENNRPGELKVSADLQKVIMLP